MVKILYLRNEQFESRTAGTISQIISSLILEVYSVMNKSKLKDHKFNKGVLYTPWNYMMGEQLSLSSWAKDWLPEYIWIGLILKYYGRNVGLTKMSTIMEMLRKKDKELLCPSISEILSMDKSKKEFFYDTILNNIEPIVLTPLTSVIRPKDCSLFTDKFTIIEININEKIEKITDCIDDLLNHQSNESTDIRFLIVWFSILKEKIFFTEGLDVTTEAVSQYAFTEHDNEKMRMYRPSIRSLEMGLRNKEINFFSNHFWKEIGMMTKCTPIYMEDNITMDYSNQLFEDSKKAIEYIVSNNKEALLNQSKIRVITGLLTYVLKIYDEIVSNNLQNSIISRGAFRTMVETYINLKYMLKNEKDSPLIYDIFEDYGLGKYKYVVVQTREKHDEINEFHHVRIPIIEALVNYDKGEEFRDMDTRMFDNVNIRSKFEQVDEKELYDLYYEYDTNYSHGFWGAIMESSMLVCDNPAHNYHFIPDIRNDQKLSDIRYDCNMILSKLMNTVSKIYEIPGNLKKSFEESHD